MRIPEMWCYHEIYSPSDPKKRHYADLLSVDEVVKAGGTAGLANLEKIDGIEIRSISYEHTQQVREAGIVVSHTTNRAWGNAHRYYKEHGFSRQSPDVII